MPCCSPDTCPPLLKGRHSHEEPHPFDPDPRFAVDAADAQSQTRVDLTPSVAYLNSLTDVVDQDGVAARFAGVPGFGGRLSIWLNESVMLEGSAHYGRTSLDGQIFGEETGSLDLAIFYGSAQIGFELGDLITDELSQIDTVLAVGLQFGSGGS